jgi:hypothetical protein
LKFDDFTSEPLQASTGIPQGSPLSPILYLFYSADLLELVNPKDRKQLSGGFIDDTLFAVSSPSVHENILKLQQLLLGILQWCSMHGCQFDIKKFQLVHFTRNARKYQPMPLAIEGTTITPADSAKYLGIIMDHRLRWKEQVDAAVAKGTATLLAISHLSRPSFGLLHCYMRQLFHSVVCPRMEYGLSIWYEPIRPTSSSGRRKGSVGTAKKLGKVQRLAARLITGAFQTTASDSLYYHAAIPPVEL